SSDVCSSDLVSAVHGGGAAAVGGGGGPFEVFPGEGVEGEFLHGPSLPARAARTKGAMTGRVRPSGGTALVRSGRPRVRRPRGPCPARHAGARGRGVRAAAPPMHPPFGPPSPERKRAVNHPWEQAC